MMVPLGTELPQGTVEGVQFMEGERYYFLITKDGTVSYMPGTLVEDEFVKEGAK